MKNCIVDHEGYIYIYHWLHMKCWLLAFWDDVACPTGGSAPCGHISHVGIFGISSSPDHRGACEHGFSPRDGDRNPDGSFGEILEQWFVGGPAILRNSNGHRWCQRNTFILSTAGKKLTLKTSSLFLFIYLFLRQKADRLAPKHKLQLTT